MLIEAHMKHCCPQLVIVILLGYAIVTTLTAMHVSPAKQQEMELTTFGEHKQEAITTIADRTTTLDDSQKKANRLTQFLRAILEQLPFELIDIIQAYDAYTMQCVQQCNVGTLAPWEQGYAITGITPINGFLAVEHLHGPLTLWDLSKQACVCTLKIRTDDDDDDWRGYWITTPLHNGKLAAAIDNNCLAISVGQHTDDNKQYTPSVTCLGVCWEGTRFIEISALIDLGNNLFAIGSEHGLIQIRSPEGSEQHVSLGIRRNFGISSSRGSCIKNLTGHTKTVQALLYFPNNGWLVSGSDDGTIKIWNWLKGNCLHTISEHKGAVYALAGLSNREFASGASDDGNIHIWDVATGERVHTLQTGGKGVLRLSALPNGLLVCLLKDYTIQIWDINYIQCVQIVQCDEKKPIVDLKATVNTCAFFTALANGTIKRWE
jgi:WD40 repeat protein